MDLTLNGITLTDQFEWNINDELSSPENFAKILCADLVRMFFADFQGLGNEFEVSIAHSIREQIMVFKKKLSEHRENEIQYFQRPIPVENPYRDVSTVANWGPSITTVANPNQKKFAELRSVYEEERRKKKDREYEEIIRADITANTRPSRAASAVAVQKMEES